MWNVNKRWDKHKKIEFKKIQKYLISTGHDPLNTNIKNINVRFLSRELGLNRYLIRKYFELCTNKKIQEFL